jgi:hypothetical protein
MWVCVGGEGFCGVWCGVFGLLGSGGGFGVELVWVVGVGGGCFGGGVVGVWWVVVLVKVVLLGVLRWLFGLLRL